MVWLSPGYGEIGLGLYLYFKTLCVKGVYLNFPLNKMRGQICPCTCKYSGIIVGVVYPS